MVRRSTSPSAGIGIGASTTSKLAGVGRPEGRDFSRIWRFIRVSLQYLTCQPLTCNLIGAMGTVQQEIRQRRPFGSTAQEAIVALLRTADLVRRQTTALVEPHGITMQQFNVLRI